MDLNDKITKEMHQIVDKYANWPNDISTRVSLKNDLSFYLAFCVSRKEIYDYRVYCDIANNSQAMIDNNILRVDVYISDPLNIHVAYETTGGNVSFGDFSTHKEVDYMAITREIAGG